ncbi:MAG: hypothetical protein WAT81_03475 [Candidatus Moraniibacteriota bacterium]
MGTVHSLAAAAVHLDRLRRCFDLALPSSSPGQNQSAPEMFVFSGMSLFALQAAGQVADVILSGAILLGLSCARQQLRFFRLLP